MVFSSKRMDIFSHSGDHIMPQSLRISLVEKSDLITYCSSWLYTCVTSFWVERESPGSPERQTRSFAAFMLHPRSNEGFLCRSEAGLHPRTSRPARWHPLPGMERRGDGEQSRLSAVLPAAGDEGCQHHPLGMERGLRAAFSTINLNAELGFLVLTASLDN